MKHAIGLCLAMALAASAAHAGELAKWKNAGVVNVLTNEPGACKTGANIIRAEKDEAPQREGCYTLDPKTVHVVWADGTAEKFDIKKFRPTREALVAAEKERMENEKDLVDRNERRERDVPTGDRTQPSRQSSTGGN